MAKSNLYKILPQLVGEICCVTKPIKKKNAGKVRIWGSDFPATADSHVKKGQWVRVVDHSRNALHVDPMNVWLGSCCC